MSLGSIADTSVKIMPSKKLLRIINSNADQLTEIPENISKALKKNGFGVPSKCEILDFQNDDKSQKVNIKLLHEIRQTESGNDVDNESNDPSSKNYEKRENPLKADLPLEVFLTISDLRWLTNFLTKLRQNGTENVFLHDLIETCSLTLPKNEILERNPELEARCKKLREEQLNREYRKMTKDVDPTIKHLPEDTIAYQMKAINSQIIAVLQFVFSVVAGFVFGFLGIELIVGNLDFGFRLLLGIIFALIIALAEIYFLAKKLNEYDVIPDDSKFRGSPQKKKSHTD